MVLKLNYPDLKTTKVRLQTNLLLALYFIEQVPLFNKSRFKSSGAACCFVVFFCQQQFWRGGGEGPTAVCTAVRRTSVV